MRPHILCAKPVLDLAYFAPDRGTKYEWSESAPEIATFFKEGYRAAGYLYCYFRNEGNAPLRPAAFRLNDKPLEELRAAREVIWWRLLPNPVPPGAVGEVMIRLRSPMTGEARISVDFESGESLAAKVAPAPPGIRIETVGYSSRLDTVFLVVERLDGKKRRLSRVSLDGQPVTAKILDPDFTHDVCPIVLRPSSPLKAGTYHVYRVVTDSGEAVACCLRAHDGWVPLGSYGYGTYEEYARNGANGHNCFGIHSKADLDSQARLQMRGVMIIGDSKPANYMIGHPGLLGYCLQDEPDCWDYSATEAPAHQRLGYHAMDLERRARTCRETDPSKPILLTLDLTYKPANYYVYGPLADIVNPDCYSLSWGQPARVVREVMETARYGAGPHPVTFTFLGGYEEPLEPEAKKKRAFPRPPFAEEQRIILHYAIGAGARGLFNYIHCTERSGQILSHGSNEYPDVWNEIGQTFRELDHVSPLLTLAHPAKIATANHEKCWTRTLLCGEQCVLIVCVNDDYEELPLTFRVHPLNDLRVQLPRLSWLTPKAAWRVTADGFEPVRSSPSSTGTEIQLGRLNAAEVLLVSSNPQIVRELTERYQRRQEAIGVGILADHRARLDRDARQIDTMRRVVGELHDFMLVGNGVGAYGVTSANYWNPLNETYNLFEFGRNEAGADQARGAEWKLTVPPEEAGKQYVVFLIVGVWGRPGFFSVRDPKGAEVLSRELAGDTGRGELHRVEFTPAVAGDYALSFLQPGDGPKGGRATHAIYVAPADRVRL